MTYADLGEVKASLRLADADEQYDDAIERILTSIDTEIDNHCRRTFTLAQTASSRTFPAQLPTVVIVDDVSTAAGMIVETGSAGGWSVVAASAYQPEPANGMANGRPWPVTRLTALDGLAWPPGPARGVRVTGVWGWPSVPGPVKEAAVLLAVRTLKRPDAPFGVTFGDLGAIQVQMRDPDITSKLEPYQRPGGFG